jgi:hypothetical protein
VNLDVFSGVSGIADLEHPLLSIGGRLAVFFGAGLNRGQTQMNTDSAPKSGFDDAARVSIRLHGGLGLCACELRVSSLFAPFSGGALVSFTEAAVKVGQAFESGGVADFRNLHVCVDEVRVHDSGVGIRRLLGVRRSPRYMMEFPNCAMGSG